MKIDANREARGAAVSPMDYLDPIEETKDHLAASRVRYATKTATMCNSLQIKKVDPRVAFSGWNEIESKYLPPHLFYAGDLELLDSPRVSVVGSRKITNDGRRRATLIVKELIKRKIVVVSGLAEGVDTVAHNTAIDHGGKTITVVGTPLTSVYPKSNEALFKTISIDHLALSQFDEDQRYGPKAFPMRNRTMALFSDATIVIEASEKSGTRHQGWEALRLGRPLFILESIVEDKQISWAKKMLEYGAQVLTRDSVSNAFDELPSMSLANSATF